MGSDEGQKPSRDQQTADDGYRHRNVDTGSEWRKRNADGGEGRRRNHAIGLPLRKISFEALPIGSVKHHRDSPARVPAGGIKAGQEARNTQARCPQ